MIENRKTVIIPTDFYQRVQDGIYDPMYWIRVGLPIAPGQSCAELTTALHATFKRDLLNNHRTYTTRESLREEPSTFLGLAVDTYRKQKPKRSTVMMPPVPVDPKPEFAKWAHDMLIDAEIEVTNKAKCQNATSYQCDMMRVFDRKLEAFRKAEKLASLPKDATIEDKIDAGYYDENGAAFQRDVLKSAGTFDVDDPRLKKIFDKANELRGDEGRSAVLDEFWELLALLK